MKRLSSIATVILLTLPHLLLAQALQMVLPDGNGTWTVRVATSGGFLGTGSGDFAVSSEGKVVCSREIRCPKDFSSSNFRSLIEAIPIDAQVQPAASIQILCNDCITRTMTISHRDAMGIVHTYAVSWNDATKTQVPTEFIRIYDALVEVMK